jgi:hypothetical protein
VNNIWPLKESIPFNAGLVIIGLARKYCFIFEKVMMDDIVSHSRKPVVCRYFAASGTCFYGNDCQFLHNSVPRSSVSPTFSSPVRSANSTASNSTDLNVSVLENNCLHHSFGKNVNTIPLSNSAISIKDEYLQKSQELSVSPVLQLAGGSNSSLFEVCCLFL